LEKSGRRHFSDTKRGSARNSFFLTPLWPIGVRPSKRYTNITRSNVDAVTVNRSVANTAHDKRACALNRSAAASLNQHTLVSSNPRITDNCAGRGVTLLRLRVSAVNQTRRRADKAGGRRASAPAHCTKPDDDTSHHHHRRRHTVFEYVDSPKREARRLPKTGVLKTLNGTCDRKRNSSAK